MYDRILTSHILLTSKLVMHKPSGNIVSEKRSYAEFTLKISPVNTKAQSSKQKFIADAQLELRLNHKYRLQVYIYLLVELTSMDTLLKWTKQSNLHVTYL